jgi:hypothetical protein
LDLDLTTRRLSSSPTVPVVNSGEVAAQVVDAGDAPGVSGGDGGQDDVQNGEEILGVRTAKSNDSRSVEEAWPKVLWATASLGRWWLNHCTVN